MRYLIVLIGMALLVSCKNNEIRTALEQSDSINIRFNNSSLNSMSSDKNAIRTLARFISDNEKSLPLECEIKPSGMILFYYQGKQQHEVAFTDLTQRCRYFILQLKGKTVYTEVTNEAADFLKALQEGKSGPLSPEGGT